MATTMKISPVAIWAATDAGFRIWGKAWTDMATLLGLTEIYSNIDWSTVVMPTTTPVWAGKRVYKLDDALSSTREVYVQLSFGRTSTSTDLGFAVKVDVGTQYDGSGNVSGYLISEFFNMTQAPPDGGDMIGVITPNIGFSIWTNINGAGKYQAGFSVERLCENGLPTPDGVVTMFSGQGNSTYTGTYGASAFWKTANYASGIVFATVGPTGALSSSKTFQNVQVIPETSDPSYAGKAPAIMMDTFGKYDPCYHWILVNKNLYSPGTEFDATINGVTGKYRTPSAGFLADHGSLSTNQKYVALKVA